MNWRRVFAFALIHFVLGTTVSVVIYYQLSDLSTETSTVLQFLVGGGVWVTIYFLFVRGLSSSPYANAFALFLLASVLGNAILYLVLGEVHFSRSEIADLGWLAVGTELGKRASLPNRGAPR